MRFTCDFCDGHVVAWNTDPNLKYCRQCGATSVLDPETTVTYDWAYVAERYEKYPLNDAMSRLRLRVLEGVRTLCREPWIGRLLDVGYGNGSFLRAVQIAGWDAYGHDINPAQYPGVRRVDLPLQPDGPSYDVITFYDTLEHFPDVRLLQPLVWTADWLIISAPMPPPTFPQRLDWKHFRPGEHHHYPTPRALEALFRMPGRHAELRYVDYPEDRIRGKLPTGDNIFTVALKCRDDWKEG